MLLYYRIIKLTVKAQVINSCDSFLKIDSFQALVLEGKFIPHIFPLLLDIHALNTTHQESVKLFAFLLDTII
jgi:hypothetical protein